MGIRHGPRDVFFQLKAVILAFQVWSWMNLTAAPDFKMLGVRINNWYQLIGYRNITVRCIYNKIYSEWYSRLLSILVNLKNNSSINSHQFQLHGLSRCGGLHKYLFVGTFVINVDFVLERKSYPRSWLVYKTLGGPQTLYQWEKNHHQFNKRTIFSHNLRHLFFWCLGRNHKESFKTNFCWKILFFTKWGFHVFPQASKHLVRRYLDTKNIPKTPSQ